MGGPLTIAFKKARSGSFIIARKNKPNLGQIPSGKGKPHPCQVNDDDRLFLVDDLKNTFLGDSNLDGEFNSGDLVEVFTVGKYETREPIGWAGGDWDGNGVFDSSDFVLVFADGCYECGPRAAAVPEPSGLMLLAFGLLIFRSYRRRIR